MTSIELDRPARFALPTTAEGRLRAVLATNAATSLAAGAVAAAAPRWVADLLDIGVPGWVRVVGLLLLVFAADVALVARARPAAMKRWAVAVSAADLAWVAATVTLVATGTFGTAGTVVAAVMGVGVLDFALLQLRFARRLR